MTSSPDESGLEQWDLTSQNSPYLDRHMMFPLLEYLDGLILAGSVSYSSKDVAAARLALLRPTHMVDYAVDTYKSVHGENADIPKEMEEQKSQVFKQQEEMEEGCKPLLDLSNNEEEKVRAKIRTHFNPWFHCCLSPIQSNFHFVCFHRRFRPSTWPPDGGTSRSYARNLT